MEAQALYVGYCIRERRHVRAADSVARQRQGPNVAQVRLVLPAPVDEESLQGWKRQHKLAKSLDFHWIKQCQRILTWLTLITYQATVCCGLLGKQLSNCSQSKVYTVACVKI